MSSDEWYYAKDGERLGPVPLDALRAMLADNTVKPGDFVWCPGMSDWQPAGAMAELAPRSAGGNLAGNSSPVTGQTAPAMMGYYRASASAGQYVPYAGFWMRFAAAFIDGVILWVVGMLITLGISAISSPMAPVRGARGMTPGGELYLLGNCFSFVIQFLYYTLQESSAAQATLGKRALGIRVTNMFGERISYGQAVGRFFGKYVSAIILCIGYLMAGWTERKQALHDMMAGTLVVANR